MSNLTPSASWDDVTQIETTTPVLGGPGGPANVPHQELANRTEYLKDRIGEFVGLATADPAAVGTSSQKGTGTRAARENHIHALTKAVLNSVGAALGQSLATPGYQKLPGGLILQWGSLSNTGGTATFPITFPNACLAVFATNTDRQGSRVDNAFAYAVSASQFYIANKASTSDSLSGYPAAWFAIGY